VTPEKRYFAQLSQTVTKEKIVTTRTLVEASPFLRVFSHLRKARGSTAKRGGVRQYVQFSSKLITLKREASPFLLLN
jgi:hypothetical protein